MSNNAPNSPDEDDFEELENELKRLIPSGLDRGFLGKLEAEQIDTEANSNDGASKRRLLTLLVVAACLALLLTNVLHWSGIFGGAKEPAVTAETLIDPGELDSLVSDSRNTHSQFRFQPVSSEGFLIDATSGRVIQSDNGGLQRQLNLEFQDVDHWHDPTTSTNIRIYSPRREVIQVPLRTD